MDDEIDMLSQFSEGFLKSDDQSAVTESVCPTTLDDEQLAVATEMFDDEEEELPFELPRHACCYCGIHDPACVALCTVCNKHFCNGKGSSSSSHLVTHLVRSTHRTGVVLHAQGLLGETEVECYHCGSKNIFMLGYLKAKTDNVIVMLCRLPCASLAQKNSNFDAEEWKPLIQDHQIVSWVLKSPSTPQQMRARQITTSKINRLEELWKEFPDATVEDLDRPDLNAEPEPVRLRYEDGNQYFHVMAPLVQCEADYDRKMKEAISYPVTQVKWSVGINKKTTAAFTLPDFRDGNTKLMIGDELRLKHQQTLDGSEWVCEGRIIKIPDNYNEKFVLEVSKNTDMPSNKRTNFLCEFVWKGTAFKRMHDALLRLANRKSCVSQYIYHKLMGHDVNDIRFQLNLPKKLETPGLPPLNHSQEEAVRHALLQPLSLIQGPPGTGKTVTSAALVYNLVKFTKEKVLVSCPSNIAVDQLAEKLHLTGLKVCRYVAKGREMVESSVNFLTLHSQVKALQGEGELKKLMLLQEEFGELSATDEARYRQLLTVKEKELLNKAEVICATCIGSASPQLRQIEFRCALIDECNQSTEPETLVPILRGVRQLILVGDHCQLGPVVMSKQASQAGFSKSLVERLVMLGNRPLRLTVQYRMHPILSVFPSNVFYEGSLQNGVTENDRVLSNVDWNFPNPSKPMMFWNCCGNEEISPSGTSFLNRAEAVAVEKLTTRLLKAGFHPSQISIITAYEGQRAYIVQYMQSQGTLHSKLYLEIEVANVDAFQGREKDIIIVTCVRSNSTGGIGFLSDPRRLNVALTRARYGLVIIGNANVLARQSLWHNLITMFRDKGCLVDGPLNNLRKSMMDLPNPRPITERDIRTHGLMAMTLMNQTISMDRSLKSKEIIENEVYSCSDSRTYANSGVLSVDPQTAMFTANITNSSIPVPLHMFAHCIQGASDGQGNAFGSSENSVPLVWLPPPSGRV
ncbi:Regulator of nonsense transcripts 1 [Aphelenchoides besseyi]|nr:Regulator of nonsense transcripts 1 [Aphelenchoides besseyi]